MTDSGEESPTSKCLKVNGGHVEIPFDARNFKRVNRDEYTNETLPDDLVRTAIREELAYFNGRVFGKSRTSSQPRLTRMPRLSVAVGSFATRAIRLRQTSELGSWRAK